MRYGLDFPILDIYDVELGEVWLQEYFHPQVLRCPKCRASEKQVHVFRRTDGGQVTQHRCHHRQGVYADYTSIMFANKQLEYVLVVAHISLKPR
jgi:hypothetical protein